MTDDREYPWPPYEDHEPRAGSPAAEPPQWAKVIIIIVISALGLLCLAILVALLLGALDRSLRWAFG